MLDVGVFHVWNLFIYFDEQKVIWLVFQTFAYNYIWSEPSETPG